MGFPSSKGSKKNISDAPIERPSSRSSGAASNKSHGRRLASVFAVFKSRVTSIERDRRFIHADSSWSSHRRAVEVDGCMKVKTQRESLKRSYSSSSTRGGIDPDREVHDERPIRARVAFSNVYMTPHLMTLGDQVPEIEPDGPPVCLDYRQVLTTETHSVDDYEDTKPRCRRRYEFLFPGWYRTWLLLRESRVSRGRMIKAQRINDETRRSREAQMDKMRSTTRFFVNNRCPREEWSYVLTTQEMTKGSKRPPSLVPASSLGSFSSRESCDAEPPVPSTIYINHN